MPQAEDDPSYWMELAADDLASAEILKNGNAPPPNTIYHYHQAAEKVLKGLIVTTGNPFTFIHDLGELLKLYGEVGGKNVDEVAPLVLSLQYRYQHLRYPRGERMTMGDVEVSRNAFLGLLLFLGIELPNKHL